MNEEDKKQLDIAKKQAMTTLIDADCFMLISINGDDVKLTRGMSDGIQKLAMVGATSLAMTTMNGETLVDGASEKREGMH